MSTLSRAEIRRMKRIWSKVPPITGCKGLCWDACSNAPTHPVETLYLIEKYGAKIETDKLNIGISMGAPCQFLTERKRCAIYEDRPLVCRVFRHPVGRLHCRHGCKTENPLTSEQSANLMWEMCNAANEVGPCVSPDQLREFSERREILSMMEPK